MKPKSSRKPRRGWGPAAAGALLIVVLCVGHLVSTSLTLTTYYPAPFGVYDQLRATGATGDILLAYRGGNVGVGTASPEATLDVNGAILSRSPRFLIHGFDNDGFFWFRTRGDEPRSAFLGFHGRPGGDADSVVINPRGRWPPALFVNHEGNVGVGSDSPQLRAPNGAVRGNLDANDVFLRAAGRWASRPSCRVVVASNNVTPATTFASYAGCAADEWLSGGGGQCEVPGSDLCAGVSRGFLHLNGPQGNGWVVDCFANNWGGEACSRAWAICCK